MSIHRLCQPEEEHSLLQEGSARVAGLVQRRGRL